MNEEEDEKKKPAALPTEHGSNKIEVDDIVVIVDEHLPRNTWPMAPAVSTKNSERQRNAFCNSADQERQYYYLIFDIAVTIRISHPLC